MTPERHQRVGELYLLALDWTAEQRTAGLSSMCQGDAALQREIESLLSYDAATHPVIDGTALDVLGRAIALQQAHSWIGQQVGRYRIVSVLRHGGMGEVYRACDVRLDRNVAVKALPRIYSADADRLRRFEQEARAAGQLNHPNVLTIYDIGLHEGSPFIVAEMLDGEELRDVLGRGPLPQRAALEYAQQIARGLAATHARGIVHRDLKPENLFVTSDGRVKILDFGLAKLTAQWSADLRAIPSSARADTVPGLLMGTIGYASPEQLRGEPADHRADIFAFGAVLYEMLTGRRPFERESLADVMAAILKEAPAAITDLAPATPPVLARIVDRCLAKSRDARFQSAADLEVALAALSSPWLAAPDTRDSTTTLAGPAPHRPESRVARAVIWMLVSLASAGIGGMVVWNAQKVVPLSAGRIARFVLGTHISGVFPLNLALSPDGGYLAYTLSRRGLLTLYSLNLANEEPTPVATFEGADSPFFSPDSRWLGFFQSGKLKTVPVRGGPPSALADAPSNRHADWGPDGSIVFAPLGRSGLFQIPTTGGTPVALTSPEASRSETSHVHPHWLPGGKAVVYVARGETLADLTLKAYSLDDRQTRVLVKGGVQPTYLSTGHLVFVDQDTLMAAPFDAARLVLRGTPTPIVHNVQAYGVSDQGTLIYASGTPTTAQRLRLVWVNRNGASETLNLPADGYLSPRLAPGGRQVVLTIDEAVWTYDLARNVLTRLTFGGRNLWPIWSHDGRRVIYASNRAGTLFDLYSKLADGTEAEQPLLVKPGFQIASSVSRDGHVLGFTEFGPTDQDIALLSLDDGTVQPVVSSAAFPSLSPDGRWMTYPSRESGRQEIYVRPTSGARGKWLISVGGGAEPVWARSGSEIFYRHGDEMVAVPVSTASGFEHGSARTLFAGAYEFDLHDIPNYDVTPDGQRFLMVRDATEPVASQLHVVLNWPEELRRQVPTR